MYQTEVVPSNSKRLFLQNNSELHLKVVWYTGSKKISGIYYWSLWVLYFWQDTAWDLQEVPTQVFAEQASQIKMIRDSVTKELKTLSMYFDVEEVKESRKWFCFNHLFFIQLLHSQNVAIIVSSCEEYTNCRLDGVSIQFHFQSTLKTTRQNILKRLF